MTLADLLAALTSGDDTRAEEAARRLPEYGQPALDALQALLHTGAEDGRWWAVRALTEFPAGAEIRGSLLAALEDESSDVRQAATLGLARHPAAEAIAPLARALASREPLNAKLAANALIALGAPAVPALLETLENGSPAARIEACRALAEIRDQRAIPALMKAFQSDSAILHYWAEQGLEKLGLNMIFMKPE
ncbi:MAG: hypothetical protein OHK0031_06420 [Anaerolineales bacterium]